MEQSSEWALCKYVFFSTCHGFLGFWRWVCYKYFDRNRICSCMKRWILSNKYFAKISVQLLTHFRSIVKLVQQWSAKSQTRRGLIQGLILRWKVKMHWKLSCWGREKWRVFFVRNHSWDESHLIFVVMTFAQKHAAKMLCWHKAVRYYHYEGRSGYYTTEMKWCWRRKWQKQDKM